MILDILSRIFSNLPQLAHNKIFDLERKCLSYTTTTKYHEHVYATQKLKLIKK